MNKGSEARRCGRHPTQEGQTALGRNSQIKSRKTIPSVMADKIQKTGFKSEANATISHKQ